MRLQAETVHGLRKGQGEKIVAIWLVALAVAAVAPPPANDQIVVTANAIGSLAAALQDCIDRHCPPLADIAATQKYAEALFIAGNYKLARKTLNSSIARNRGAAPDEPDAVSGLYRAASRVSLHLGEGEDYVAETYRMVRVLKQGRVRNEAEILLSQIETADARTNQGDPLFAKKMLASIQMRARKLGLVQIMTMAQLKAAWLEYYANRNRGEAVARLKEIAASSDPALSHWRVAARVLAMRLHAGSREPQLDLLRTSNDPLPAHQLFVWAPTLDTSAVREASGKVTASGGFNDKWADIGFRVRRDGRVDEVEVLNSRGGSGWLQMATRNVAARLYTPLPSSADDSGDYRIERQTYTSFYTVRVGSRTRTRDGIPRIEVVDLSRPDTPI